MSAEPGYATPVDSMAARLVRLYLDLVDKPPQRFHRGTETLAVSVMRNPNSIDLDNNPVETDLILVNIDHYTIKVTALSEFFSDTEMPRIFLENKFNWRKQQVYTRDRRNPTDDILVCKYGLRMMGKITRDQVLTDQQLLRGIVQRTWGVVDKLKQEPGDAS